MKLAEKLEYLQTTNMSIWLETRAKVFEELSDKQQFMCICGRLPSSLHERSCTKFNNKVTSENCQATKTLVANRKSLKENYMPEPLEVLWSLAPVEIKLELSLNVIVEVLKMSEGIRAEITLDDGEYEIVLNKLD